MAAQDDTRVGPAGEVLAANIARVRTAQRISFAELSRLMTDIGRPIPELGLRRIERGERRVDFDDLLALCYVLKICPVDLMISKDAADDDPYPVTPKDEFLYDSVREWMRGENVHLHRYNRARPVGSAGVPGLLYPGKVMTDVLDWMPEERARRVALQYYGPSGPYDDLNDPEGRHR